MDALTDMAIGVSKKRSGITGMVVNFIKELVPNMFLPRHRNEKATTPKELKPATSTTFFASTAEFNLSNVQQLDKPVKKPTVTMGDACKKAGFLGHNDASTLSSIKKATESIIPRVLT